MPVKPVYPDHDTPKLARLSKAVGRATKLLHKNPVEKLEVGYTVLLLLPI